MRSVGGDDDFLESRWVGQCVDTPNRCIAANKAFIRYLQVELQQLVH